MPKLLFKKLKVVQQRNITAGILVPTPYPANPEECPDHGRTLSNECIEQAIGDPNDGGGSG